MLDLIGQTVELDVNGDWDDPEQGTLVAVSDRMALVRMPNCDSLQRFFPDEIRPLER